MTSKPIYNFSFLLLILFTLINTSSAQSVFSYPITRTEAFDTVIYNKKLCDNYAWISRSENEVEMLA